MSVQQFQQSPSESGQILDGKHQEYVPVLTISLQQPAEDSSSRISFSIQSSTHQDLPVQENLQSQPFYASISDINQDQTLTVSDFHQPKPIYPYKQMTKKQDNEDLWCETKESIQVLRRRRSSQFSKVRNQNETIYDNYGYQRGGSYRGHSRNKYARQQNNRYYRPYQHAKHQRSFAYVNNYQRNYDDRRTDYQRNAYNYKRTVGSSNTHKPAQDNCYVNGYSSGQVQQGWNANLWLHYLSLRENLKYLDMYYYQNYPQIASQMLYGTPALYQTPQQIYPAHFTNEAYYGNKEQIITAVNPLPEPFGNICLPKFEIIVQKCCISVTCCKMDRFRTTDILFIPYTSSNFGLYPGFKPEDYFTAKERGESIIKNQVLRPQTVNGKVVLVTTDKSSFKSLAFAKVSSPYEQSFNTCFNRALSNVISESPGKTAVIPYCNQFSSSQEKAKLLVDLLHGEVKGWQNIIVNCQDLASFKRMVQGFSRIVSQLEERGALQF